MPSKRTLIFGGIGIAILAAIVVFLLAPDPQTMVRQATRALVREKTARLDVKARMTALPLEVGGAVTPSATGVDVVVRTDLDRTDPLNPASVSTFAFTQAAAGGNAKLSGEMRRKDQEWYLRLDAAGGLDAATGKRLISTWVSAKQSFLDILVPPSERALAERPLDAAGLEAMSQAISNVDLLVVTKKLPRETIDGVKTYHEAVSVNMQALSALMLKLRELRTGAPLGSDDVLEATAEIIRWGTPVGEVWIDPHSRRFRRIELATAAGEGAAAGSILLDIDFSRYGQPITVDVPNAQDIESLLGPLFAKRLTRAGERALAATDTKATASAPAPVVGTAADTDGDGLSDSQEAFYGSDAWNPDTDGDGWADGLEVEKGMDPLGPGPLFGFGL